MRGDGSVAGEGRVVGVPKSHSWGKCTMHPQTHQPTLEALPYFEGTLLLFCTKYKI